MKVQYSDTFILPTNYTTFMEHDKTILLGKDGKTVYTLTLDDGELKYDEYREVFSYEEGEERAIDSLKDDPYFWKEAVANDNTTASLEDYAEDAVNIDGWRHILGEDNIIDIDDMEYYFAEEHSEGEGLPFDYIEDFSQIFIEIEDFDKLTDGIEKNDPKLFEEVFAKYEEFEAKNLTDLI